MPTTTTGGIEYWEHGDYSESWGASACQVTRLISCEWKDRRLIVPAFLGTAKVIRNSVLRALPEFHPEFERLPAVAMDLTNIAGVPYDTGDGVLRFRTWTAGNLDAEGRAFYRVTHQDVPYRLWEDERTAKEYDRFTTKLETYASEAQLIPGTTFKYVADNVPVNTQQSLKRFTKEITYIWHHVPHYQTDYIEDGINKINSADWDGYNSGTLLFVAPAKVIKLYPSGQRAYEITYKFLWRRDGWNKFFRRDGASGPGYYSVVANDGSGKTPYETYDFNKLFQVNVFQGAGF